MNVAIVGHDPERSWAVAPGAADLSVRLLAHVPGVAAALFRRIPMKYWARYLRWMERRSRQGVSLHLLVRKLWIEEQTRSALSAGTQQVVILGAGLDTLALRLHREFPDVRFYEVDHPATLALKRNAVRELSPGDNLALIPEDFSSRGTADVLRSLPGHDPSLATLVIAEGLLMYLTEPQVRTLLSEASAAGAGSQLLCSLLTPLPNGRLGVPGVTRSVNWRLRLVGEPFRWGIPASDLPLFLSALGWREVRVVHTREIAGRYVPAGVATPLVGDLGEYLASATRP